MPKSSKEELIMPSILAEVDRARDWPLRVLSFTSVLHFGVIVAVVSLDKDFSCLGKTGLISLFTILMVWTIIYFKKCHIGYLKMRNTQRRFQKSIGFEDGEVFPPGWLDEDSEHWSNRFWGWGYYAFIAFSFWLSLISILLFRQSIFNT